MIERKPPVLRGYDAWKTREPEPFNDPYMGKCERCGQVRRLYLHLYPLAYLCIKCEDKLFSGMTDKDNDT